MRCTFPRTTHFLHQHLCIAIMTLLLLLMLVSMISHAATAEHSGTTPDTHASRINHYYLVTWDPKSVANRKAFDERLSEQAGSLLKLWKAGKIENVYLDPKPTDREGKHIGTVAFFVRAATPTDAHAVLAEMPFVKDRIVMYQLNEVGAFWLGRPEDLNNAIN